MERDVGLAVPQTTETRYRDGSDQSRYTKTTQDHIPTTFFIRAILL